MSLVTVLTRDARQALRGMRSRPGFAFAAVGMLALGIGIATAMFTIVDVLILCPVPFREPDRLAHVMMRSKSGGSYTVAPAVLRAWRDAPGFAAAEAADAATVLVAAGGSVSMRGGARVTPGLFQLLGGVRPVRGRLFDRTEGGAGTDDRVLISEDLWRALYGADPAILDRHIVIDGESLIVVGILPSEFRFPEWNTVIWRPIDYDAPPPGRDADRPTVYVRFAAGLPQEEALRLAMTAAHNADPTTTALWPWARPLAGLVLDDYSQRAVPLLAGAVGLVFLVLCANVCSLLLGRLSDAKREFGIRAALGASRAGLLRQALVESSVVGLAGAIAGAVVGWALVAAARGFLPEAFLLQTLNPLNLDGRGLAIASVAGITATLASGLLPAWIGTAVDGGEALRGAGRAGTDSRAAVAVTRALLIGEIALACMLLTAGTLLVRSFINLMGVETGVDTSRVITATMTLPPNAFPDHAARAALATSIDQGLRDLPGVRQVVWSMGLPPDGGGFMSYDWVPDTPGSAGITARVFTFNVTADFFPMYGIPIVNGRGFHASDTDTRVVIGERFARMMWPGADPLGRTFTYRRSGGQPMSKPAPVYEVIGVARELNTPTLDARMDGPEFYLPFTGVGAYAMMSVGCGVGCPDPALLRQQISTTHPSIRVNEVRTLDSAYAELLARPRAAAALAFVFAVIAVVAAAGGLFSVLSYAVGRRRREFGIRAAVGASPSQLGQLIMREGAVVTLAGVAIGAIAATALGRALASLQYGVTAGDPISWAMILGAIAFTTLVAAWRPTHEAIRTDPVVLLRED